MAVYSPATKPLSCQSASRPQLGCLHARSRAVAVHARHGSRRRWWSDAWQGGDSEGQSPDGPASDPGSAVDPVTTFLCADGTIVQLGARPNPRLAELAEQRRRRRPANDALPLPEEQGLCIGSIFRISATNGIEPTRRVSLAGFCFSTEQLYERVEGCVLARGGEVFETHRLVKSGVHEALVMTVAIPYLFGVPPEYERLKAGIKHGGGIIEKVQRSWIIY